ncbi:MAG: response regulator [Bacteroidota bacterium]
MIKLKKQPLTILIADDDEEDRLLTQEALQECEFPNVLVFAENGEEALDYLMLRGKFSERKKHQLPHLILLDLNMPRKDGREVLTEIRSNPLLKSIPVVALTTSSAPEDIRKMYTLGVNSYITKPVTFDELVAAMRSLKQYWYDVVSLPDHDQ